MALAAKLYRRLVGTMETGILFSEQMFQENFWVRLFAVDSLVGVYSGSVHITSRAPSELKHGVVLYNSDTIPLSCGRGAR